MKKLSLLEFKEHINDIHVNTFIFSMGNQRWKSIEDTVNLELVFKEIIITFSPNTVFFTDGKNTMSFCSVKSVKISDKPCPLGEVFTLVCGSGFSEDIHNREYTLIAR